MDLKEKESIIEHIESFKLSLDKPVKNLKEIYNFLEDVPVFITNFIDTAEKVCNKRKLSKEQQFTIVVYLMQYCSTYELFKNVYSCHTVEVEAIAEVKRCICKQLTSLLHNATLIFEASGDTTVGSFLNLMDLALDKIAQININEEQEAIGLELNVVSSIVEKILCLAMSVAQVAFDDDTKVITAGCRSVLNAIESLKTETTRNEPNLAMCNLAVDTCTDTLCAFEARVNTAVLRLCLKVFSEYKKPITNLYDFCVKSDKPDDNALDPIVSAFDLHMDRIFQIGFFSIASSTMGKCVADIKNVMSNLEFLEGELVPAFVAMTKDSMLHRKLFANILKNSWCTQVKLLQKAVHSVIEPSAYCKLIYDELKQKVEELWQELLEGKNVGNSTIDAFLSYTKEVGQMFTECMDTFDPNMRDRIKNQLKIVYKVLNELAAARKLHETSKQPHEFSMRIFKRCQVLLLTIKRLWLSTMKESQATQTFSVSDGKINNPKECSATRTNTVLIENVKEDNLVLDSIVFKSKQILKDRSFCHINQTCVTFTHTLKDNKIKIVGEEKLHHYSNLRDCSYRQNKRFMEGSDYISIAQSVHPRIKSLRSEVMDQVG